MSSAKRVKFFGLTIAFIGTRGSSAFKPLIKFPKKVDLPKSKPGNFLVSPLSVEVLLALILAGARENTSKEIANALLLPQNPNRIQQAFQELSHTFQGNENYTLSSTNKIYIQNGTKLNAEYEKIATSSFNSDIQFIDFRNKDHAVNEVNKWISEKSDNRLADVVNTDNFDEPVCMVLINTIYYKGRSIKEFSRAITGKRRFFINQSDYVNINILESIGYFNYSENARLKARLLEVPYEGNDIAATLVLPDEKTGLADLETHIAELFFVPPYKRESVHVRLPKCKFDTSINFTAILQGLGVKDAFENSANFSGILENRDPLKITTVIHNSFIDGEEVYKPSIIGTRLLETITNPSSLDAARKFYVDRPFVFYLKHKVTGVFFIGRLCRIDGAIKNFPVSAKIESNGPSNRKT